MPQENPKKPSAPVPKKTCRSCYYNFDAEADYCPACGHPCGYTREIVAALFSLLILGLTIFFLASDRLAPITFFTAKPSTWNEPAEAPRSHEFESGRSLPVTSESHSSPPMAATSPRTRSASIPASAVSSYQQTAFKQTSEKFPFYVAERRWDPAARKFQFYRVGIHGTERTNVSDARRYFLSENQRNYPEPQSGCGPVALLNLYIWYTNFGLLRESVKHSDQERYKQLKFREIDQKIREIQRQSRTQAGGTNALEQVVAIDEIAQANSPSPLRIHFEYKLPPLNTADFLNLSRNYRAGILSVRPRDPRTGRLGGYHAVLVIRGDTAGKITVANWGAFSHGQLVNRSDGQWFIPDDPTQHALQIHRLTTLIPITPTESRRI